MVKRIIAVMIAAVMLVSLAGVCFAEVKANPAGDVNYDGKYNLFDVSTMLKYIAGWELPYAENDDFEVRADMNLDGVVNLHDASFYMRWVAEDYYPYL